VAFHAQQAAEKAMKAALLLSGIEPPRTHDLDGLCELLPGDWRVKQKHHRLDRLTEHAAERRYPDDVSPVSSIQAATAVRQAIAIVREVREDFERRGVSTEGLEPA
jgi:HEPN domain-containing protein